MIRSRELLACWPHRRRACEATDFRCSKRHRIQNFRRYFVVTPCDLNCIETRLHAEFCQHGRLTHVFQLGFGFDATDPVH